MDCFYRLEEAYAVNPNARTSYSRTLQADTNKALLNKAATTAIGETEICISSSSLAIISFTA